MNVVSSYIEFEVSLVYVRHWAGGGVRGEERETEGEKRGTEEGRRRETKRQAERQRG